MARKSKYNPDTFPLLAEGHARNELNDAQIATKLGVGLSSFYSYQKKYPQFLDALKRGRIPVNFKVENTLLKKCYGYDVDETHTTMKISQGGEAKVTEIKKVTKHIQPDATSIIFYLKNKMPETYKNRHDVNVDFEDLNKIANALMGQGND
ncbi:MAG: transposase [Candidatus Aminicenantes bacterium]|nr:transposase [Candidatus Aminicenantes bacterium]